MYITIRQKISASKGIDPDIFFYVEIHSTIKVALHYWSKFELNTVANKELFM